MRTFNTQVEQIDFNDLPRNEKEKYVQLLEQKKIKMTYDMDKEEYVALLTIQQEIKKAQRIRNKNKRQKREQIEKRTKSQNHIGHKDCYEQIIKNRKKPEKIYRRKSFKKFPENEAFFNKQKMAMITKYQFVFDKINFFELTSIPIIIPILKLARYIEIMYGLYFEQVTRKRTYKALDLSQTIYNYYDNLYSDNYNFKRMFIAKWMYSLDTYKHLREVDFFRQILIKTIDDDIILYFLYLRENFRFQTQNYFLDHDKHQQDPREIQIDVKFAIIILQTAFYFNVGFQHNVIEKLKKFCNKKKTISYYDFLFFSLNDTHPLQLESLELLTYLIALYDEEDDTIPEIYYKKKFFKTPVETSKIVNKQKQLNEKKAQNNEYYGVKNRRISNFIQPIQPKVEEQYERNDVIEEFIEEKQEWDPRDQKALNFLQDFYGEKTQKKESTEKSEKQSVMRKISKKVSFRKNETSDIQSNNEIISTQRLSMTKKKSSIHKEIQLENKLENIMNKKNQEFVNEHDESVLKNQLSKYEQFKKKSGIKKPFLQIIEDQIEQSIQDLDEYDTLNFNENPAKMVKEMLCDKFLRIFLTIKSNDSEKFFSLLRIKHNPTSMNWKRLVSEYDFCFLRPQLVRTHVERFFTIILEIQEFKEEMEFIVQNTLNPDEQVENLLELKDSIFLQ